MSASRIHNTMHMAACLGAALLGGLVGIHWARSNDGETVPAEEMPPGSRLLAPQLTAAPGTAARSPEEKGRPLRATLRRERELATIDPAEFPALVEAELRNATTSEGVDSIAAVWAERDPEGLHAWLLRKSGTFTLQEGGIGVGFAGTLLSAVARDDLEKAWEMAGELPGDPEWQRMRLLSSTLRTDPEQALALVRAHRDAISLSDSAYWGQCDPLTTVPLAKELLPGPGRKKMIDDAANYFFDHPEKIEESKTWFARLTPELRALARKSPEGREFSRPDPEVWKKLLDAWNGEGANGG